ncbi:MAG: hypothetical protein JSS53_08230, partial [Proteobacteria bacterium]|nr:hypothetical protein [Pseudomonadota bacterium]
LKFPVDNQTDDSPVTRTEFASSSQAFILCRFRDGKGVDFGTEKLSYAQIVALAGDYFGVPEKPISESSQESERQIRFKEHFNQLAKNENLASLVSWIFWIAKWIPDRLNAQTIAYTKLLGKSYSQLLATNFDHFAPFSWDAYQAGHQLALELAIDARNQYDKNKSGGRALLAAAYLVDGYASHFLSDSFSSGHLRVPRASMAKIGGLILGGMSVNDMHEADGEDGLIVCTPGNEQWFARGDGHLEGVNRNCVIAALQQSVEDIFEAFKERKKPLDRVSALVPSKVLAAGETGRNPDSDRSLKQTFPRFKFGDGASVVTQKDPSPYPQNPRTAYTDTFDKKKAEDLAGLGRRAGASVIYSDFDTADLSRVPQMDLEKEQRCLTANKIREDGPVHRF